MPLPTTAHDKHFTFRVKVVLMKQPAPLWALAVLVLLGLTWMTPGWAEQCTALVTIGLGALAHRAKKGDLSWP